MKPLTIKTCTKCGISKPFKDFHKKKASKDGYKPRCKACISIDSREYTVANRDEISRRKKDDREQNPEKIKANKKRDYLKHKDKRNAKTSEWYHKNKDRILLEQKIRRAGEAGRNIRCRYAKIRGLRIRETSDGSINKASKVELYEMQDGMCYICGCDLTQLKSRNVHLDHIQPLSKGGKHIIENVAWSCSSCNLRKANND